MKNFIEKLLNESKFDEAEKFIFSEIRNNNFLHLLELYACVLKSQKKWEGLIDVLKIISLIEGWTSSNYASLIQALRNIGDLEAAERMAKKAVIKFPKNISIQSEFAWNAQVQGDWVEAVRRLEVLIELNDFLPSARVVKRLNYAKEEVAKLKKISFDFQKDSFEISRDLILTTYPEHKSQNVGDNLICYSAMQLIKSRNSSFNPFIVFRDVSLDNLSNAKIKKIIAPGFSVSQKVYPDIYKLYKDLDRLPQFYPVGCSFQSPNPSVKAFEENDYDKKTLEFLDFVVRRSGPLPCRDLMIVQMLHRNNIDAYYIGDMAIYDENYIFKEFENISCINSVVFTIQHSPRYNDQASNLINLIKKYCKAAKLYVAFHSKPNENSLRIANYANDIGFEILHLYGDVENLKIYDRIDVHIGYRLHGHISFLRRRKPSILMVEDVRSLGFCKTTGTSIGCFEGLTSNGDQVDESAPIQAMDFFCDQISVGFRDYRSTFKFIDETYANFVSPFFDRISK